MANEPAFRPPAELVARTIDVDRSHDCPRCGVGDGCHALACPTLHGERRAIDARLLKPAETLPLPSSLPAEIPDGACARLAWDGVHGQEYELRRVGPGLVHELRALEYLADEHPVDRTDRHAQRIALEGIGRLLLETLDQDLTDPSLKETPRRWAKWWQEFLGYQDPNTETVFDQVGSGQMVGVTGVRVWSMCEHHLLPFWCDVAMAYRPTDRILGLSKFGRIAHLYAHKLQVQERLVRQIADHIARVTGSPDVAVVGQGEHLCMTMRGARTPAEMTTSDLRGRFDSDDRTRQEFFALIGKGRPVSGA